MKVGLGFDLHRLVKGRKLILGGVNIPHDKGLLGVSDADVILHSLSDALLGALGKGDIGDYFPSDNPRNKGISSRLILKKILALLKDRKIENVDLTVVLEEPKLKKYKDKILSNLSTLLELPRTRLNLKIKSQEALIPARKECIICFSLVSIK